LEGRSLKEEDGPSHLIEPGEIELNSRSSTADQLNTKNRRVNKTRSRTPFNVLVKVKGTVIVTLVRLDGTTKEFPPGEMLPEYPTLVKVVPFIVAVPPPPTCKPRNEPPALLVCPATQGVQLF